MLNVEVVEKLAKSLDDDDLELWLVLFQREFAERRTHLFVKQEVEVAAPCA